MLNMILTLCLLGALIACYAEGKVIKDLSHRLDDAQMWIDPVEWEETNDNQ